LNIKESTSKSSHKFARSGSATAKSLVTILALVMFLLYVTSVGVSASNSTGSISPATLGHTTTVYRTKTVTKTVYDHDTTTLTATSTVTDTSTSVSTSTSTVTDTTTSAVCCQTTTTTVTEPVVTTTVTSTVTETPNIQSGSGTFTDTDTTDNPLSTTLFDNTGATTPDCQLTIMVTSDGISKASSDSGGNVELQSITTLGTTHVELFTVIALGSDTPIPFTNTMSGAKLQLNFYFPNGNPDGDTVDAYYSWTAICPS
jgi:hypothetical protein